jgi:hypothetical protein
MENQQVEKFDPSKLMDGVKDRIKATFVSLIPDAQWEQMCNSEMKKFFEPRYSGYDNKTKNPSQFEEIVINIMQEHCKAYFREMINKPEYKMEVVWKNSSYGNASAKEIQLPDHLDAMIKEKMPEMMQAMFASVMSSAFYDFFNHIQNKVQLR